MRFGTRTLFVVIAITALLAALIGGAIRGINRAYSTAGDFYAIHQTHEMLYRYVSANEGGWPSSWEDLIPYFQATKDVYWSEDIASLKKMVEIDFAVDVDNFRMSHAHYSSPPRLLSLKSHRNDIGWSELEEVNRRLASTLLGWSADSSSDTRQVDGIVAEVPSQLPED